MFAHRQGEAENARGNCPGPDIWYNVGEWAVRELAMSDGGKGYKEGNGSPIPDNWRRPRSLTGAPFRRTNASTGRRTDQRCRIWLLSRSEA